MDPFASFRDGSQRTGWQLRDLDPLPEEEWRRMLDFLNLSQAEHSAMLATVEALFRRGHELVVATYDYLLNNPETAAVLGWEQQADEAHLAERRRFFTLWLTRVIGLDTSADLARYLFRAGRLHAGHGPRHTHVPPVFVTGSMSLVHSAFARFLSEEMPGDVVVPTALAGWNKLLSTHLHLMQMGYQAARELDNGDFAVPVVLFGKMRQITGTQQMAMHLVQGAQMRHALRKFFNYFPEARVEVFDVEWQSSEHLDRTGTLWFQAERAYALKPTWRVLNTGKDMDYLAGIETAIQPGDEIHIFPPGR
ncbi:MAG: hypothetical protein HY328_01850 [Chloroflexi bacterium]|nr:hypothetical protein [Chloroflexota bacterium]